jgi:hypothetical protein
MGLAFPGRLESSESLHRLPDFFSYGDSVPARAEERVGVLHRRGRRSPVRGRFSAMQMRSRQCSLDVDRRTNTTVVRSDNDT